MPLSSFMSANSECWEPGLSHWKEQFNIKLIDEETNGIKRQPTNAFGVIEFVGSTHKSEGKVRKLRIRNSEKINLMQRFYSFVIIMPMRKLGILFFIDLSILPL